MARLRGGLLGVVALLAGCGERGGGAQDAGAVACRTGDRFASSHAPDDPCATDSDCHDSFLACVSQTVFICRDSNTPTGSPGCPATPLDDAPVCPATAQVSLHLCQAAYQQPCKADNDCGPNGFACEGGLCQTTASGSCQTKADCAAGWDCYAPCCPNGPKYCEPPFAVFRCPECQPFLPDGAAFDPDAPAGGNGDAAHASL